MRARAVGQFRNIPPGSGVSSDVISLYLNRSCLCALSGDLYVTFNSCYNLLNNKQLLRHVQHPDAAQRILHRNESIIRIKKFQSWEYLINLLFWCMINSRRVRWEGHVARMRLKRNACSVFVGELEGKRPLGRTSSRWENNVTCTEFRD
jgi:hypothetical protein